MLLKQRNRFNDKLAIELLVMSNSNSDMAACGFKIPTLIQK